ncbi:hypothetical protein A3C23_05015 [Candidatus Roizmanbacteria bacterium RIFCSPHIGHO2_02_FULL_37_13b]|uniref:Type II toxin-antitoxin system mRNA interferase toxin, RelE/StbE family n=1 Tax=Candidatus Roizmanbacteria bacterium RIFCSPLOWO2_02_FULL_36_11 TaxID=1802071 RepID=A0A1F7JIM9_9BACT|nr:MAG: hypothetical protein A3C23_05015 [Candidatus Roizmanbacteria bacterium RIFCSPHIGHO2_02_FULL_37_13b]OGK55456.1 MAG: hypothetical protein A3H78_01200 [Candidatus Roizmanbacteria bacterium RIFCSPLOWO2_02_FULL_36_11]
MKIDEIYYSSEFKKSVKKYSDLKKIIIQRINIFKNNPFDSRLKTHKLTGKLKDCWSFSINFQLRILFEFISDTKVGFIDIGSHDIYKSY